MASSTGRPEARNRAVIASYQRLRRILGTTLARQLGRQLAERGEANPAFEDLGDIAVSPLKRGTVAAELRKVSGVEDLGYLAILLEAAEEEDSEQPRIEVCWTGPQPKKRGGARGTAAALEELIQSARQSLLVVGYRIDSGAGQVLRLLEQKAATGIGLTFLLDRGAATREFMTWARGLGGRAEVYVRPESPADPMSALHAKCVIVDGEQGLFGSANLTFHGMKGNVELGLLVRDRDVVQRVVDLFEELRLQLVRKRA